MISNRTLLELVRLTDTFDHPQINRLIAVFGISQLNSKGKSKRYGPRPTALKTRKKAIVQLAPGETITIFEGV